MAGGLQSTPGSIETGCMTWRVLSPGGHRFLEQRDQGYCLSPSGLAPLVGGLTVLLCTVWALRQGPLCPSITCAREVLLPHFSFPLPLREPVSFC